MVMRNRALAGALNPDAEEDSATDEKQEGSDLVE